MILTYKNPRLIPQKNENKRITWVTATCPLCAKEFDVRLISLTTGNTKSCGCGQGEKHGECKTRLYKVWSNMRTRCFNKKATYYENYGGRGITICKAWDKSFISFRDWAMSHGYKETLMIERNDNDGDYCPINCSWVTRTEQNRNMRSNVTYKKECAAEASIRLGGNTQLVQSRVQRGWSLEKAFSTPIKKVAHG